MALALRDASQQVSDLSVKKEIAAAAALGGGFTGDPMTINEFCTRLGFSPDTREAVIKRMTRPDLADDTFEFDGAEFENQLPYRTVELDSGAMLSARSSDFDEVFEQQVVDASKDKVRYSATGSVVGEKLEKTK